jgi:hypothetical protein
MQPIPDPPPWIEPAPVIPEPIALTDDQLLRIARAILRHTVEHKLGGLYPDKVRDDLREAGLDLTEPQVADVFELLRDFSFITSMGYNRPWSVHPALRHPLWRPGRDLTLADCVRQVITYEYQHRSHERKGISE